MRFRFVLPLLAVAALSHGQGDPSIIEKILDEGKHHNQATALLYELTHKVGPRVTGSPGLAKAQQWAMGKFKKWGLTNVHLDPCFVVPVGFDRGPSTGRMIAPYDVPFEFSTNNWTPGTHGPLKSHVALEPHTMAEFERDKAMLKGAWVLCSGEVKMRGPSNDEPADVRGALNKLGIAGRIYGSPSELVWSHGKYADKTFENRPTEVEVMVRKSDFDRIKRNVEKKRETIVEFNLDNRWIKGPLQQYNVVADIPGTEKPDEIVVISAHLDSWNTPGSQGANDDGTGVVKAMEAARLLMKSGAKPKRTIRILLFAGEEQGLLGSDAYAKAHPDEMAKTSAMLHDDGGTGYQAGYAAPEPMRAIVEPAFAPVAKAFPEFPMKFDVVKTLKDGAGSDNHSFAIVGVPALYVRLAGTYDYRRIWHTQHDRFEEAVPAYLTQASTNHAVVAYNLACAATMLPRE